MRVSHNKSVSLMGYTSCLLVDAMDGSLVPPSRVWLLEPYIPSWQERPEVMKKVCLPSSTRIKKSSSSSVAVMIYDGLNWPMVGHRPSPGR